MATSTNLRRILRRASLTSAVIAGVFALAPAVLAPLSDYGTTYDVTKAGREGLRVVAGASTLIAHKIDLPSYLHVLHPPGFAIRQHHLAIIFLVNAPIAFALWFAITMLLVVPVFVIEAAVRGRKRGSE